jgi:hypothetical protein
VGWERLLLPPLGGQGGIISFLWGWGKKVLEAKPIRVGWVWEERELLKIGWGSRISIRIKEKGV